MVRRRKAVVRHRAGESGLILYLDTSALVKLYADEPHSPLVRRSVAEAAALYTHLVTYAEARAAFAQKLRLGSLTEASLAVHRAELDRDWQALGILQPDDAMVRQAGDLADRFGLRGYDSLHLAAAEGLLRQGPANMELCFAAFDLSLSAAARALGMTTLLPPD